MDLNTLYLAFFIAIFAYAFFKKDTGSTWFTAFTHNKRNYYSLAIAIFALGALVRIYKFGEVPAGINQDGAMAAVDAYALSQYGTDRFLMPFPAHFTAWGYGQMSVLLSYLMVPFIKIFGLSVFAIRLPILIVSLVSIWVLFSFLQKVFGKEIALIGLFFASLNPWHIMQSRWALDCNLLPHFLLFSVYFLYLGLKNRKFLFLSMVFFALTMYTYGIAFYAIPILLILLSIILLKNKLVSLKDFFFCILTYLAVSLPIIFVVLINTFKLKTIKLFIFTLPFFQNSVRKNDLLPFSKDIWNQFLDNVKSLIDVAFIQKEDLLWNTIKDYGALYLFALPLILAGVVYLFLTYKKKSDAKTGSFFIMAWTLTAIFSGIFVNGVNINRINIIFYPLIILASLGFYFILFKKIGNNIITLISALIITISFSSFANAYFGSHSKLLAKSFFDGFGKGVEYAEKSGSDIIYITSNTQYENSKNVSEILTLFYAKTDAKYFNNQKELYDNFGKKLLPYEERYIYINPKNFDTQNAPKGIFVIKKEEAKYFDSAKYTLSLFNDYIVAMEKQP